MTQIPSWTRIIGLSVLISLFLTVSASAAVPDAQHWWKFENDATDSGNGSLTLTGQPTFTPVFNGTFAINGTYSTNVTPFGFWGLATGLEQTYDAFTYSVWFNNRTNLTNGPYLFHQFASGGNSDNFLQFNHGGAEVNRLDYFSRLGIGSSRPFMYTAVDWADNDEWTNVVVAATENGNFSIYENGLLKNTTDIGGSTWTLRNGRFAVGGQEQSGNTGFQGVIDEFQFWTSELTASEILENYNVFNAPPASLNFTELRIEALDSFTNLPISTLEANITNGTNSFSNSTSDGTLVFAGLADGSTYNINLTSDESGGYLQQFFVNFVNLSTEIDARLYQNYVTVNATQLFTDADITDLNVTTTGVQSFNSLVGYDAILMPNGTFEITGNAGGYFQVKKNITLGIRTNTTVQLDFYDAIGNLTILNRNTETQVDVDFIVNITDGSFPEFVAWNGFGGEAQFVPLVVGETLTFSLQPANLFTNTTTDFTINGTPNALIMFSDVINSVSLDVFHEPTNKMFGSFGAPNETVTLDFIGSSGASVFTQNLSTMNGSITTNLVEGSYEIRYSANGFDKRSYFFNLSGTNALTADLYLLDSNLSSLILVNVIDQDENQIQEAIVKVLRQYVDEGGAFKVIEMIKTDTLGQNPINIVPNTQDYQFLIEVNNEVVFRSATNQKITTDTIFFKVDLIIDLFDEILGLEGVQESLTFDNSTDTFTLTYSDTSGNTQEGCLIVENGLSTIYRCANSTATTLQYTIPDNNSSYIARSRYQGVEGSRVIGNILEVLDTTNRELLGTFGLALGMLILLGLALTGVFNPQTVVIVTGVGLVILSFSNLLVINQASVVGVLVVGIIIAFISNRGVR